ncbi:MAG: trypsin-like peptidase domain-containing protein [Planctomycetes bacterium]|nr:trypsin-like peptidase domain-containing protein [Planctomycetota bacterium]
MKEVAPAVVSIEAKQKLKRTMRLPGTDDSMPTQAPKSDLPFGFGSGVIVDAKGIILTNYHVVEGADSVEISLPDGRRFTSKEWSGDRKTDLAIVRITSERPLPFLELGDSDGMEVGDRVLAIGAPFGLTGSVTHGIISAKSRNLRLNQYEDFLQTDAAINPGNSGGPLVSLEGKVIGINSAIKSKSGGFQGVGLAISSNLARTIMQQLLKNGTVKRGYLGVQIRDMDAELAARFNLKEGSGVMITKVFDQSPAWKAGLKVSDVVFSIAGKPVRDGIDLQKVVSTLPLNQAVDVALQRDGKPLELKLTIEVQPEEFGVNPPKTVP